MVQYTAGSVSASPVIQLRDTFGLLGPALLSAVLCCPVLLADIRSKLLPVLLEWDMQQQAAEGEDHEDSSGKVGGTGSGSFPAPEFTADLHCLGTELLTFIKCNNIAVLCRWSSGQPRFKRCTARRAGLTPSQACVHGSMMGLYWPTVGSIGLAAVVSC